MQIDITTTSTRFAVDIVDSIFTRKWVTYMKNISQHRGHRHKVLGKNFKIVSWSPQQPNIQVTRQKIVETIDKLETALNYCQDKITVYDWTLAFDTLARVKFRWRSKVDIRQTDLNILHRCFTAQVLAGNQKLGDDPVLEKRVHDINETVHQLETFVSWNSLALREKYKCVCYDVRYTDANFNSLDQSLFFHRIREDIFDHRAQKTDYNVWLAPDILGKDLICCYLDEDDPSNVDITGNHFMTPNIMIDPERHYNKILRSTEFNQWHSKHCPDKMFNRFPIGNVDLNKYPISDNLSRDEVLLYSIR